MRSLLKLTSPGVLLILAVVSAAGIFFADVYYLRPQLTEREWDTLRQRAGQAKFRAVQAIKRSEEHLADHADACIRAGSLASGALNREDVARSLRELFADGDVDLAWMTDRDGRVLTVWSPEDRDEDLRAVLSRRVDAIGAVGAARSRRTGLIRVGDVPALFAAVPAADGGQLWIARNLNGEALPDISESIGSDLVLLRAADLPTDTFDSADEGGATWLFDTDHIAQAWPATDAGGEKIGHFRVTENVKQVRKQAAAARRMMLIVSALSVGLALLVIIGTHMLITGPVVRLLKRIQMVESGQGDAGELTRDMHGEPLVLARQLESAFERLEHISNTDSLTGLANRLHFTSVLSTFYSQARRYSRPLSVIALDIDFFKAINDTGGHAAGDELLKAIARAIENACRKSDLPARVGGDEFFILLPETRAAEAGEMADRIRSNIDSRKFNVSGLEVEITLSVGVADLNAGRITKPEEMLALADRALYAAKERGRDRIVQACDLGDESAPGESPESGRVGVLYREMAGVDVRFRDALVRTLHELMRMLSERDPHTARHAHRVQKYAVLAASEMDLPANVLDRLEVAALVHDIGMLALPDSILLNPGPLTDEQRRIVERHPLLSVRVMEGMKFLQQEIPAVRYHHERFDGNGYPEGISGQEIPLSARILAVADALDAITSPRPFSEPRSLDAAIAELQDSAGTQFDPDVVQAMVSAYQRLGEELLQDSEPVTDQLVARGKD